MNNRVKIANFINKLKTQIRNNTDKEYVLLNLDKENDVNELSRLLKEKESLKYIINMFNQNNYYHHKKSDTFWSLRITGFKYGAAKNSDRKIGLIACKYGKSFNFKTAIFYNSEHYSLYYTINNTSYKYDDDSINDYINNIIILMDSYLEIPDKYESDINYIKKTRNNKKKIKK